MLEGSLEPGQVVGGRWRIDRYLAAGGFGQVFAATDTSAAAIGSVAVKVLLEGASTAERQAFLSEARHMGSLRHPNLVEHIDSGILVESEAGAVYLVIDLCEESLDDYCNRQSTGRMHRSDLESLVADVSAGLDYLHGSGRVHRDLKPANILRSGDSWKLADFGLVRDLSASGVYHLQGVAGTPRYMAPEFFNQGSIGPAVDIWAFGVTVHQALTGQGVHTADGPALIHAVSSTEPTISQQLDSSTTRLLNGCLTVDPANRARAAELPGLLAGREAAKTVSLSAINPGGAGGPATAGAAAGVGGSAVGIAGDATEAPTAAADTVVAPAVTVSDLESSGSGRRWLVPALLGVAMLVGAGALIAVLAGRSDDATPEVGSEAVAAPGDSATDVDDLDDAPVAEGDGTTAEESIEVPVGARSDVPLGEFSPDDCADVEDLERFTIDAIVPCDEPHLFQVLAVFEAPQAGEEYPGPAELLNNAVVFCPRAFADRYGYDQSETSLSVLSFNPTEDDWNDRVYNQVCTLSRADLQPLVVPIGDDVEEWLWKPGDSLSIIELQPGFCFDAPVALADGFQQRVLIADCAEPHDGEHIGNQLLSWADDGTYPGRDAVAGEARVLCHEQLHDRFGENHNEAGFTSTALIQTQEEAERLAGELLAVCVAVFPEPTVGTLEELASG